jgi:hypothetical protein
LTVWAGYGEGKNSIAMTDSYPTDDPIPSSLPGTALAPAPAPPPDRP